MDREVMRLRDSLIPKYSSLVYNGFWFSPEREALQTFVKETQGRVKGYGSVEAVQGKHDCGRAKKS